MCETNAITVFIQDNLARTNEKERETLVIHIKRAVTDCGINNDTRKDTANRTIYMTI